MNSRLQEAMLKHGIEIRCQVSGPEVKWWMGRFGNSAALFPAGICKDLSADIDCDHLFALESIDIHSEEASVSLVGQSDSELVYQAARSVAFQSTRISMDYLKVEEAFRGLGISVKPVRNAYTLARRLNRASQP
jgi:hypothetical protein